MRPPGTHDGPVVPRVGRVWVVMATTGEWSDRSEWPVRAHFHETAAKADVEAFTARCRAAQAAKPEYPDVDYSDAAWDRATAAWDRAVNRLTKGLADCGGDMDASFFVYEVAIAAPSVARERSDTGHRDRSDEQVPGNTPDQDQRP